MDFYTQIGTVALGSRLRRLSETLTEDASHIYALYEVTLDPKWFPVFYVLSQQPSASITELAQQIGHSHPSVSHIVKEMKHQGLVTSTKQPTDARVSVVSLTDTGAQLVPKLETQCRDVSQAVEDLLTEAQHDLWKSLEVVEGLLAQQSLLQRVKAVRNAREHPHIEIIDYAPQFHADFKRLNLEWIEQYFTVEASDLQALDHSEEKIVHPGGHIYLARYHGEIVGTCALIRQNEETYELAKMAVAAHARGKGIGWRLGQAAVTKARHLGAKTIYLESNTRLKPAIALYQKLGFKRTYGRPSPYQRCNIQMELALTL